MELMSNLERKQRMNPYIRIGMVDPTEIGSGSYKNVVENYTINHNDDTVIVSFRNPSQENTLEYHFALKLYENYKNFFPSISDGHINRNGVFNYRAQKMKNINKDEIPNIDTIEEIEKYLSKTHNLLLNMIENGLLYTDTKHYNFGYDKEDNIKALDIDCNFCLFFPQQFDVLKQKSDTFGFSWIEYFNCMQITLLLLTFYRFFPADLENKNTAFKYFFEKYDKMGMDFYSVFEIVTQADYMKMPLAVKIELNIHNVHYTCDNMYQLVQHYSSNMLRTWGLSSLIPNISSNMYTCYEMYLHYAANEKNDFESYIFKIAL